MSLVDLKPSEQEPGQPARPRIVALLNQKGGVGKTTSTVNLGAALARYGKRVLLIDLDPQSNLSLHFGVEPSEGQASAHELLANPETRLADVLMQARPGLDFVPAVTELALVEGELANRPDMQHVLRHKLEPVLGNYDIVLLDCPPSLGVLSVNALTVADEVFVPMQAHYLPLRGLEKLLQTVHMVSQSLNPNIKVTGVLLCMHEGQSSHSRAVIDEIESQLAQYRGSGLPWQDARVLQPAVRRNIKLAEAPSFGMTIFDYAPRCPGADDYRRLAEQLLVQWQMSVPEFDWFRPRKRRSDAGGEHAEGGEHVEGGERPARRRTRKSASSGKRAKKAAARPPLRSKRKQAKAAPIAPARRKALATRVKPKASVRQKPSKAAKHARGASTRGANTRDRKRRVIRSGGLSL